jgi:glutathione-specific gamma-glutamylcyclotransferase
MRLTEELVARVHREIADPGPPPDLDHFTQEQYDESVQKILAERPTGPVQIFCYGSLIWKPSFTPAATARATAVGWQRRFCLRQERFRGTKEQPGLMMQIDRGGFCEGIIQQVDQVAEWETLSALWRREMTVHPPSNFPRWIDVEVKGKVMRAVAFTANPESKNYRPGLSIDEVAKILAVACGHWGSGADYLRQTVVSLHREGIHDDYLWDLQERVAREIEG